ncbi:hypothetical protein HPB47_027543 [Ixodes persulcatus]|uniref:Uncharacterized protein n=1 Tax=Ixodes persulcatus TaxID=34615 RepID=A0AC60PVQ3_IXOPE|nr:hypothetical protein HPB47_027543 [Ixodes persulcatus]
MLAGATLRARNGAKGAAPLEDGRSPAELLMGREPRTLLPDFTASPASPVRKHVQNETKKRQLAPLQQGDIDGSVKHKCKAWWPQGHTRCLPRTAGSSAVTETIFERHRKNSLSPSTTATQRTATTIACHHQEMDHSPPHCQSLLETRRRLAHQTLPVLEQASAGAGRQSKRPRRLPQRLGYIQGFQQAELI